MKQEKRICKGHYENKASVIILVLQPLIALGISEALREFWLLPTSYPHRVSAQSSLDSWVLSEGTREFR